MRRIAVAILATVLTALPATVYTASATYEYDTKGRVSKITYDEGTVVDYAYNLNGNRTSETRTTPPPDTTPPTAPGTPTFNNITATSATASWTAATDNKGVFGYDYQLNAGVWQSLTNVLSVNLTGLSNATSYTFHVRARDAAGSLGPASSNSFTTPDNVQPTVPTGLSGSAPNSSTVNFTWNASTDNVAVTGYRVFRGGASIGTTATTSFSDGGRTGSTPYSYQVAAYDAVPNESIPSAAISVTTPDTIRPSIPASLSAAAGGPSKINLSWGASTDTGGSGLAGYKIYRGPSFVTTTTSTSYSDTGLASTTSYSYTVYAYDQAGNDSFVSNTASATTLAPVVASVNVNTWLWKKRGNNPMTIDPPRVCTGSGGSGGYTYAWQYVSGDTVIGANTPTSNATDWSRSGMDVHGTYSAIWRCLVTDSLGNTGQNTVTVTFSRIIL